MYNSCNKLLTGLYSVEAVLISHYYMLVSKVNHKSWEHAKANPIPV